MFRLTDLTIYREARALGQHWDGVIRRSPIAGEPPPADLTQLIHYLHGVWDADRRPSPTGDPTLDRLLARHQETNTMPSTSQALPFPANHRQSTVPRLLPPPTVPTFTPRLRIAMIVAAVGLLLLAAGIVASQLVDRSGPGGRAGIPAASVAGTPSPEAEDEALLEIMIPAEAVPSGDAIVPALGYNVLEPGRSGVWEPICCSGPMLEYVVSGVYTVRPEAEIDVIRAGGKTERIAAGAETTLVAGDALLTDITVVMESANHGTEPVDLLVWFLFDYSASPFGGKAFPGWVQVTEDLPWSTFDLTGSLTLRLSLVELEPDAVLEPEPGSLQMGVTAPGQAGYTTNPMDDSIGIVSFDDSTVSVYVLTLEGAGAAATPAP